MSQGPLYQQGYKPQFSGHQTFPLRYGWLKKAYDAVVGTASQTDNKNIFLDDGAIARFGVGKNMVASIRHWANASGIIDEPKDSPVIRTTELGNKLFGNNGLDQYMEHPATLWLVHWNLAGVRTRKTTWFWAFSHFLSINFEREKIIKEIVRLAIDRSWSISAGTTLKNDVACFIRTYATQKTGGQTRHEDALESPLTELKLIKTINRDHFYFVRGPKSTLGDGVFTYALLDFWNCVSSSSSTLSFESIAYAPGSPGRTFLLDENDVASYLSRLEVTTKGMLLWSETSGLRQVVRESSKRSKLPLSYIDRDFIIPAKRKVA